MQIMHMHKTSPVDLTHVATRTCAQTRDLHHNRLLQTELVTSSRKGYVKRFKTYRKFSNLVPLIVLAGGKHKIEQVTRYPSCNV